MTAFIGEALRIEHAINSLHPFGYEATINDQDMVFAPGPADEGRGGRGRGHRGRASSHACRADVREFGRPGWSRAEPRPPSPPRDGLDVGSVFVNALPSPGDFDQRLEWPEDQDGNPVRPFWASSDTDDALYQPHAVAKFRATAKLCLAGRIQKDLERPGACRGCEFKACRSNPEPGAPRTYWTTAAVPAH